MGAPGPASEYLTPSPPGPGMGARGPVVRQPPRARAGGEVGRREGAGVPEAHTLSKEFLLLKHSPPQQGAPGGEAPGRGYPD